MKCILCYSDETLKDIKYIKENDIVISTYQSSKKLLDYTFNTIIFDECHTTVLSSFREETSDFQLMLLKGLCEKKFFFTATEKTVSLSEDKYIFSMDNDEQYGKVLFEYKLDEAIMDGYLCDYNLNMIVTNDKTKSIIKEIKEKKATRILIYCSSVHKAKELSEKIKDNIFCEYLSSDHNKKYQDDILQQFKDYQGISVLCLCKLFVVGFDEPSIDMIVHFDKCESVIELTQKNGRATRLCPKRKVRSTFVFMIEENKPEDLRYYKKVMRRLILEDSRLEARLKELKTSKNNEYHPVKLLLDIEDVTDYKLIYDRYVRDLCPSSHSKEEYDKLKRYVKRLGLTSSTEYRERLRTDPVLIPNPDDYFGQYVWEGWYTFLGVSVEGYIQDKEEWAKRCKELNITSWPQYKEVCKDHPELPPDPCDFYPNYTNFGRETGNDIPFF